MPERVLPNALSGEEVRLAILDKVGQRLQRDCFLSENLSYDFFECHVSISLTAHDVGRAAKVEVQETITQGSRPEDAALDAAEAEFDIERQAPNEVRIETGQGVPVLT